MIHGNSNDPVFIKKILLKIWTLRAEIESVLHEKTKTSDKEMGLEELIHEYTVQEEAGDGGEILDFVAGDAPEDDMEAAMAAAIDGDEPEGLETLEETASEEPGGDLEQSDLIKIFQRKPNIPPENLHSGKAILSEINMDEMYFFSNQNFLAGQSIVIEFVVPKRFVANAIVSFCRNYNLKSRIISPGRLAYRVGIKFSFLKKGERTLLRQFIGSIEPDIVAGVVGDTSDGPIVGPAGGDDDSFDELDDLDL